MRKLAKNNFKLDIEVKERIVTIIVNNNKRKPFKWIIPTQVEVNLMQKTEVKESLSKTSVPELYFSNRAGMFGFRCFGNQFAFIKSLSIS